MTDYTLGMRRYEVHKYPYVEVRFDDAYPIHAQILGWNGDMIFISAPRELLDRYSFGQQYTQWVHKDQARRIGSTDSAWISPGDDTAWHECEDAKIKYRPDPWTILGQQPHGHDVP